MSRLFHGVFFRGHGIRYCAFLSLFWICGLISGVLTILLAGHPLFALMRGTDFFSVSIVGLLGSTSLPFLFSVFAVYIHKHWLLFPICFLKGLFFSFVSLLIWGSFDSAGWLVWRLLMFSDWASLPVLFLYWLRHISGKRSCSGYEVMLIASVYVLIASVDYCYISPFCAML